ncbi:MAG TPA: hypothetical protein VJ436_06395 [Anaerolineales bacterium]|nr:hypothetical protein [Anaerolineales bacterium]
MARVKSDEPETAFPAAVQTPGQRMSREAYALLLERKSKPAWWQDYLELRAGGLDWRKAAYVAWASSPTRGRWPKTLEQLAADVLGLRSDRTIRKWKENNTELEDMIATVQIAPMLRHRRDVIDALVAVAKLKKPEGHRDRRLFLEMTGDYKPRGALALTGEDGGPIEIDLEMDYRRDMAELAAILMAARAGEGVEKEGQVTDLPLQEVDVIEDEESYEI